MNPINCPKKDIECIYRMPSEASLCSFSFCQRNFDEIIFLLQKINEKFNHINKSVETAIGDTPKPQNPSTAPNAMDHDKEKAKTVIKTVTINSSDDNNKFPTQYMTTTTKKRGRPKRNEG